VEQDPSPSFAQDEIVLNGVLPTRCERVKPRLQVAAGPLTDSTYFLTESEIRIGRDPSNSLAIVDLSLSRRHCVLSRERDRYKICDLDSRNGTFVNGGAVSERQLSHGDQISVGESLIVFLDKHRNEPKEARI